MKKILFYTLLALSLGRAYAAVNCDTITSANVKDCASQWASKTGKSLKSKATAAINTVKDAFKKTDQSISTICKLKALTLTDDEKKGCDTACKAGRFADNLVNFAYGKGSPEAKALAGLCACRCETTGNPKAANALRNLAAQ